MQKLFDHIKAYSQEQRPYILAALSSLAVSKTNLIFTVEEIQTWVAESKVKYPEINVDWADVLAVYIRG
jgi:hypothetical protein